MGGLSIGSFRPLGKVRGCAMAIEPIAKPATPQYNSGFLALRSTKQRGSIESPAWPNYYSSSRPQSTRLRAGATP